MRTNPITKIVAYLRLSKPKKGKNKAETIADAYGIEHQRQVIQRFADSIGVKVIAEFVEVETGSDADRVELGKAIHRARMHKATLVIGKQDRLGRNVHFISTLMNEGIDFVSADRPDADRMEIYFRAIIDEEELRRIGQRTKDGLQTAKEKGKLLGSSRPGHWENREHLRGFKQATEASAKARVQRALAAYEPVIEIVRDLEGQSLTVIAMRLNELGHVTTAGKPFTKQNVSRITKFFEREAA